MFTRIRLISMLAAGLMGFGLTGKLCAATRTFTASSGDWSADGNWLNSLKPVTGDDVVINTNSACTYDLTSSEPDVKSLTVSSGASIVIGSGKSLELASDDISNSTLTGNITLTSSTSGINVKGTHTIGGSGKIIGQDDSASIIVTDGKTPTLDSGATIEGKLKIVNSGTDATFKNLGTVHANASGTLWVNTYTIQDASSGSGLWKVSTSSSVLRFDPSFVSRHFVAPAVLSGDFTLEAGELDVDCPGLTTSGTLTWTGGIVNCATNNGGPATFTGS